MARARERSFMKAGGYWWLVGLGALGVGAYWYFAIRPTERRMGPGPVTGPHPQQGTLDLLREIAARAGTYNLPSIVARANAMHDEIYTTRRLTIGQNNEINNVLSTAVDAAVSSTPGGAW